MYWCKKLQQLRFLWVSKIYLIIVKVLQLRQFKNHCIKSLFSLMGIYKLYIYLRNMYKLYDSTIN